MDDFAALDEAELGQGQDAVWSNGGWKEKSKLAKVLIVASRPMRSAVLIRLFSRGGQLLGQEEVDGLEGGHLALIEPSQDVTQGFEGAGYRQADEVVADTVDHGGRGVQRVSHARSSCASAWPMAS